MANDNIQNDSPVEIYGYKTDPLRRGYQVLWNYESTYWAALVGNNDAWRLYEVLRSFCHDGKDTCNPSINLLLAILGVKERRVLTGWVKHIKGKDYKYPGLIEILQHFELVSAEVQGEGPKMRYIFHVNLTPGLLTAEQLAKLSPVLQQKHKELLERCEETKRELKSKQKPSKIKAGEQAKGSGNLPEGVWEITRGGMGNYQSNNTHITIPNKHNKQQSSKENNNNHGGELNSQKDVVVALTKLGITEKVAQHLASHHKEATIYKQIDFHEFEMATNPQKITSPRGRLRTRIEENWSPQDGYSQDWRERLAAEKAEAEQVRQNREALEASLVTQGGTKRKEQEQLRQEHLAALKKQYSTSETQEKIWTDVKSEMLGRVGEAEYKTFIAGSELLATDNHQATIWVRSGFLAKAMEKRDGSLLKRLLTKHLRVSMDDLTFEWVYPQSGSHIKAALASK